jgi:hypothetical protein
MNLVTMGVFIMINQREFTRVHVAIYVELRVGGAVVISGKLENISLNGLLLQTTTTVPEGTPCIARIHLDGGSAGPVIEAKGSVVRVEPGVLAVHFGQILDPDGLRHLSNLVLYNSGDHVDRVEAEFLSHQGLQPLS